MASARSRPPPWPCVERQEALHVVRYAAAPEQHLPQTLKEHITYIGAVVLDLAQNQAKVPVHFPE